MLKAKSTICPDFLSAVGKVMAKHTAHRHIFSGGKGVCCYVWVVGPGLTPKGNPSKKMFKTCVSSNSLDLSGTFNDDMKAIPKLRSFWVNID